MLLAGRLRLRRLFVRVLGLRCLIMWDVVGGCGGRGRGLGGRCAAWLVGDRGLPFGALWGLSTGRSLPTECDVGHT